MGALRSRDFRLYWIALIVSALGTWMQIVAQSLLVLHLSHGNATGLGLVALAQAAAFFLFSLVGGSIADRLDRRRMLLCTQSLLMLMALVVGLLVARQLIRVWMIVLASFLSGTVLSFDQPARSAFLPSLVAESDLTSAISLQSTVFTGAGALVPVLAGFSIARFGLAGNFFFNAASYLVAICVLFGLRHRSALRSGTRRAIRLWTSIPQGLEMVGRDRQLKWAVSGYALLLFAAPSMPILLPVLVDSVLHGNAASLGLLFAAFGSGTVAGALLIPPLTRHVRGDRLYLGSFAVWVGMFAVLALTHWTSLDFGALLLLGGAQGAITALTLTLLQSRVEQAMRGRMTSLQTLLNMGIRPLGDFPLSLLIEGMGAPATIAASAGVIGGFGLYLAKTRDRSWQMGAVAKTERNS